MSSLVTSPRLLAIDVPPDRLAACVGGWDRPALLESGTGFGRAGRWCYYAAEPRLVFEATGDRWSLTGDAPPRSGRDAIAALDSLLLETLPEVASPCEPDLPPFLGGWIGCLGYDLAPRLERLPRRHPYDSGIPDIRLGLYDTFAVADRERTTSFILATDLSGDGPEAVDDRLRRWADRLRRPQPSRIRPSRLGPVLADFRPDEYREAVRRALEYIAAGDIFQVNLSQRFRASGNVEPLDLYRRLSDRSPAPYAAFLRWDDLAVISASPELFYQVRGDRIITRPIKGTRPRGADPSADERLVEELRSSPKDRAELTMIVDLERNDLGRVCEYGSVVVTEPMAVESYAQVHHLVATVEGRLRDDAGAVDLIRALFPGGSITGAPKIRAMEIIDELERCRRSLYTGAIGYLGVGGEAMFNIAIRTLLVEGESVRFQAGGGIVADSDPSAEFQETLHKSRAIREVVEGWGLST